MARPILKWFFPACLAVSMSLLSLQARAQQNIVTVHDITAVPGLHTGAIIPMATNKMGSRDILAKTMASPFASSVTADAAPPPDSGGPRYPGDLEYQGGQTIQYAAHHSIFVNPSHSCRPNSCWGDPIGFLEDLGRSQMIHLVDQYVNSNASGRYTVGTNYALTGYAPSAGSGKPFTDEDMALVAYYLAAQTEGFGLNHIYHLFLVPGQDVCFDSTFSVCYSPDNGNTFYFCAYHGWVYDSAGNYAYYTVEPFQNVGGCSSRPNGPNGQRADSTNNVLSHEVFETITDPVGTSWWNLLDNGLYGEEIGDECSFLLFTSTNVYFDPSLVSLNRKQYVIQPEYSNAQHACSTNRN